MLQPTTEILETMAEATEKAIFEDDVKFACLRLMKDLQEGELEIEQISKYLFDICAEVAASTASHIAIAIFDIHQLDNAMAETQQKAYDEMENELQKIIANFTE